MRSRDDKSDMEALLQLDDQETEALHLEELRTGS